MSLPKEISLRIVGKTVFTTINRKAVKVNLDKEEKDKLKIIVEKYNKKPSDFWLNKITKAFTPSVNVEKTKAVIEKKVAKKAVKENKEQVKVLQKGAEAEAEVKAVLDKPVVEYAKLEEKAKQTEPVARQGYRRPGEH